MTGEACHHGMGYYTTSTESPPVVRCMVCHDVLPINPQVLTSDTPDSPPRPQLRVIQGGQS